MHLTVGYLATPTGDDGVALAGGARQNLRRHRRRGVGGARGTALASAAELPIRMVTLVSAENLAEAENLADLRQLQISAAEQNLALAARALPDAPEIESRVADGMTLESALKLNWTASDVLVVGSSRFAAPRRIFLGSTGARILAGTDAPVIVIPRG